MHTPQTLFEKIWQQHVVVPETPQSPAILFVDLHLVHEVTSPQAFSTLRKRGSSVRFPSRTFATMDHSTPTTPPDHRGKRLFSDARAEAQVEQLANNCSDFSIPIYAIGSPDQGIVHVIGPELGLTQPGMTIVCGDSHTSTHGAFGALAFGIGTSEVGHVLATQCLLQRKPKSFRIDVAGKLNAGVTAKDIILAIIAKIGVDGGTGHVIEYTGSAIRALTMEGRMTVCNMSIEAGARAGLVATDDATIDYIVGRRFAPEGDDLQHAISRWRQLQSDPAAQFDLELHLDASLIAPMITYGTNPGMGLPIDAPVPDPSEIVDLAQRKTLEKALRYMKLSPGQPLLGKPIDTVFLGSCTNSRISDLRAAAELLRGCNVAPGVRMLVVPGSQAVKRQAEAEGLDQIFIDAGAQWRESGCSMCIAMNGDQLEANQYAVSTSNRNFEGRQGKGSHTFLASPLTAVACAIRGVITDARTLLK